MKCVKCGKAEYTWGRTTEDWNCPECWDSMSDPAFEITRLRATIAATKAIEDRPLHDDLNVLLNRCEAQEPLSIADQRELYKWLNEKDVLMGDALEKAERLEAIVEPLETLLGTGDDDRMVRVVNTFRSEDADGGGFIVQTLDDFSQDSYDTLPEALAAAQKAAERSETDE